jgi:cytoskeletal protein CcmA (bactofilin family)
MNNRKHATELVMLMVGLTVLVCSSAQACITQVGQDGLALHAGKEIWLGAGTTVNGDIAAIGQISADSGSSLQNVTSMSGVWVGSNVQIRGDVVAGGAANAGSGLDLEGTWSGASVGLGRDARVTGSVLGGSVSIDRNARIDGSVRSNSTLWIDRDGSVTGDATPGLGYKISTGKKVSIGGSTAPAAVQIPAPDVDKPEHAWRGLHHGDHRHRRELHHHLFTDGGRGSRTGDGCDDLPWRNAAA